MSTTVKHRRGQSLHLDLPDGQERLPPIAAIFLILFDVKAGYAPIMPGAMESLLNSR